jgi:hypothetical protein
MSLQLAAMPMPEAGVPPPEAVPFEVAQGLALRKAEAAWPGARAGAVLPYLDEAGQTVAWMFHFRADGEAFPAYDEVADDIRTERASLGPNADLTRRQSRYAFVLVSARYDRAPVLAWGGGVSEYYAVGREARARARALLGPGADLSRLYFSWPRVNLEFSAGERSVVYAPHFERTWQSRAEYAADRQALRAQSMAAPGHDAEAIARVHRREWDEYLDRDFTDFAEVFVPEVGRAPFYDWSYGCTPTAAAMVCGYTDRTQEFGRLVDWFWSRYDCVEGQMDFQIPNVQRECAVRMMTDTLSGGTSIYRIGSGLRSVFQDNGYICDMIDVQGGVGNDWAWNTIVEEFNSGHAMVWSALWEIHSLTGLGYRTPEKDVYVHNTWWQPAAWWHYSGNDWSHVASPHPSGGDARKLELTFPLGDTFYGSQGRGEVLQVGDTVHVTWDIATAGSKVEIDISYNCGRDWSALATDLPDNGDYAWYIEPTTPAQDSVRLRLRQYHGSTLTSGDGSFGNFAFVREPRPPLSLAPPNGRQLMEGGITLLVDSTRTDIDSLEWRVLQSTDTVWRSKSVEPSCPLPDSLFIYGRSYKWFTRAYNHFGWGGWGTPWTFWCRFNAGVTEGQAGELPVLLRTAAVAVRPGGVRFELGPVIPGARLVVYDALGGRVRELAAAPPVAWDALDESGRLVPAGLYFARLEHEGGAATVRFLLVE